ncbi:hypothetical protein D9M71_465300 [compost metagenome]
MPERIALQRAALLQHAQRVDQRHGGAGDRGGAGAAVGLDHVAVDVQGVLAELGQVQRRAQGAADQALDFQGAPALLAAAGLALVTLAGGARQHAVLGGQPALALALEEARDSRLGADGADHLGIPEFDQHRTFGMLGVVAGDTDGAQLVGGTAAGTVHRSIL